MLTNKSVKALACFFKLQTYLLVGFPFEHCGTSQDGFKIRVVQSKFKVIWWHISTARLAIHLVSCSVSFLRHILSDDTPETSISTLAMDVFFIASYLTVLGFNLNLIMKKNGVVALFNAMVHQYGLIRTAKDERHAPGNGDKIMELLITACLFSFPVFPPIILSFFLIDAENPRYEYHLFPKSWRSSFSLACCSIEQLYSYGSCTGMIIFHWYIFLVYAPGVVSYLQFVSRKYVSHTKQLIISYVLLKQCLNDFCFQFVGAAQPPLMVNP